MNKSKRTVTLTTPDRILQAKAFDHTVFTKPRNFTRHMTTVVRYPERIYDVGRTVDVRREIEQHFTFEIRQKRYLGRGSFAISARAKGVILYTPQEDKTRIAGVVCFGAQYMILLAIMSLIVLLTFSLVFITILFLPLSLLMSAVAGLHWVYLFSDREDIRQQLVELVELTDRELRLNDQFTDYQQQTITALTNKSGTASAR